MSASEMSDMGIDTYSRTLAILEGHVLKFEKRASYNPRKGFANIRISEKGSVHGILYDITEEDFIKLDEREGGYTRKEINVILSNGEKIKAFAYFAESTNVFDGLLPSRGYIELICESADLLPKEYLDAIRTIKTLED